VNNKVLLAMQEGYSITDRKHPGCDTRQWNDFIALACDTNVVRQVIAFDVAEHNIVTSTLIKCFLKDREIGMV
jgi:hypothetical protein